MEEGKKPQNMTRENGMKSVKRSEFKGKQSLFSVIRYSAVYRERLLS